ncbi:hypothetical protein [Flavobacterium sp. TAB 87]|uniref:hypothetical protein n=1 Tax=Flavobacterium sp. TAB 87 TaxID=1729581 RepID=UPI00076C9753|nr:hypothetical protein [Flavobacterium sp. TAB 87]KVV13142.1 hypothetical protein AP058_02504 [Flavobacterium sp. TAB 87]
MDLNSAIIGIVLIIISVLPFIILRNNRKKRTKETIQQLTQLANDQQSTIHDYEIGTNFIIGIDNEKKSVFFIQKIGKKENSKVINLNDFHTFTLIKNERTIGDKKNNYTVIERLALTFAPASASTLDHELEFYDSNKTVQPSGELQSIEKWAQLIKEHYKQAKVKVAN